MVAPGFVRRARRRHPKPKVRCHLGSLVAGSGPASWAVLRMSVCFRARTFRVAVIGRFFSTGDQMRCLICCSVCAALVEGVGCLCPGPPGRPQGLRPMINERKCKK